jgi:hypothetical protein
MLPLLDLQKLEAKAKLPTTEGVQDSANNRVKTVISSSLQCVVFCVHTGRSRATTGKGHRIAPYKKMVVSGQDFKALYSR